MVHRLRILFIGLILCACAQLSAQLNTDRITSIGRNALYFEDYVLSIQYFNQVIRLKPYLSEPYLLRAIAKIQLSDYTGALLDCNRAIELNPFHPGAYYTRGYIHRQLNQLVEAENDFTQALNFSPDNKTYLLLRADVRSSQSHFDLALEDINYLLNREPKSATLLFEKGVICLHSKDTLCALEQFAKTVEYDSQNPSNWSALGMVNLLLKNEEEAMSALTRSINLGSKWAGDYINRGIIFYHNHNYRNAMSDYDNAVSLEPRNAQCYYNRAVLREELGDWNNALEDLNTAIELEPQSYEMLYQRAVAYLQLKQWEESIHDFDTLIAHYPYFLPSYYLAAQAYTALGKTKQAFIYRQKAYNLEQQKEQIQARLDSLSKPETDVQIAQSQPQKRNHRKEFSARTAQSQNDYNENDDKYDSPTRGSVQRRYTDVINEPNIALSYYNQEQSLRRTNYYHYTINNINQSNLLPAPLHLTTQEIPLQATMISQHFEQITSLSTRIENIKHQKVILSYNDSLTLCYTHLSRAIEFALVQDYSSAIDDCTQAIIHISRQLHQKETLQCLITFLRANYRYKLLEYRRANNELTQESSMDFELILRDYDYVIQYQPDFAFAYYNKANILCTQRAFDDAIRYYTMAISVDSDFAEAYFNRGLTYIYTDATEQGINDLSKAGELGIYQAYNLITRFQ